MTTTQIKSTFKQLHDQYLIKATAKRNGELPEGEFVQFIEESLARYKEIVSVLNYRILTEEYKIFKVVVEPYEEEPGKYCLSVAIESAPGYWKAYTGTTNNYPTPEDIKRIAITGRKIPVQRHAESILGIPLKLKFEG